MAGTTTRLHTGSMQCLGLPLAHVMRTPCACCEHAKQFHFLGPRSKLHRAGVLAWALLESMLLRLELEKMEMTATVRRRLNLSPRSKAAATMRVGVQGDFALAMIWILDLVKRSCFIKFILRVKQWYFFYGRRHVRWQQGACGNFINLKICRLPSLKDACRNRVYVHIFIAVSSKCVSVIVNFYICNVFLK